ncbi:UDP-2 3-diacylglucosamine hydrolase [Bienertia sinuspersici]
MFPKWKNFFSKIVNNAMPVRSNLRKRKIEVPSMCKTEISQRVWRLSWLGLSVGASKNIFIKEWCENCIRLFQKKDGKDTTRSYFTAVLRAIWLERNYIIFQGQNLRPDGIMDLSTAWYARNIRAFSLERLGQEENTRLERNVKREERKHVE